MNCSSRYEEGRGCLQLGYNCNFLGDSDDAHCDGDDNVGDGDVDGDGNV